MLCHMKEQTAGKLTEMVIKKTTEELVNVLCTFYKGCAEKGAEEEDIFYALCQ